MAYNLATFMCRLSRNSGSLKLACIWVALPSTSFSSYALPFLSLIYLALNSLILSLSYLFPLPSSLFPLCFLSLFFHYFFLSPLLLILFLPSASLFPYLSYSLFTVSVFSLNTFPLSFLCFLFLFLK